MNILFFRFFIFIFYLFLEKCFMIPDSDNVLNISDVANETMIRSFKKNGQFSVSTYIADFDNPIIKVMDAGSKLWEADEVDETVSVLNVYELNGRRKLAYVFSEKHAGVKMYYFEKINYEWFQIFSYRFDEMLRKLKIERIFDLKSDLDTETFHIDQYTLFGLKSNVFIPKSPYIVIGVYDDFEVIWERENESQTCTSIVYHGNSEDSQLLDLNIKTEFSHHRRFFCKHNGSWVEIVKNKYFSILKDLDKKEEEDKEATGDLT